MNLIQPIFIPVHVEPERCPHCGKELPEERMGMMDNIKTMLWSITFSAAAFLLAVAFIKWGLPFMDYLINK